MKAKLFFPVLLVFLQLSCTSPARDLPDNPIPFKKENKWGYVNKAKKIIIPVQFDSALVFDDGYAFVTVNGKRGTIDKKGNFIIRPVHEIEYYQTFKEGLLAVKDAKTNLAGYMNKQGEWVIKPRFGRAMWFSQGVAAAWTPDEKQWFFIDKKGNRISEPIDYLSNSHQRTYFDKGFALPTVYKFQESVRTNYGLINKNGKQILPAAYKRIQVLSPNFIEVAVWEQSWEKSGFIDSTGKEILPIAYEFAGYQDGYASLKHNKKSGLMDSTGAIVLPFQYQAIKVLGENMVAIFDSAKTSPAKTTFTFRFMNLKTKELLPAIEFEGSPENFSDGLCRVTYFPMEELMKRQEFAFFFAYINTKGELITKDYFKYAGNFSEGLALVISEDNKIGFIDKTGKLAIKCQYDYDDMQSLYGRGEFKNGLCLVSKNGNYFYIDRKGNEYVEK